MKWFLWIFLPALAGWSCGGVSANRHASASGGFAVIELFTSEGCSSCPPADKVLASLSASYPGQVYALGFHVDYWNSLGWTDRFSSPDYTKRQEAYGKQFALKSVYTPEAVVNGSAELVGSDQNGLNSLIQRGLHAGPGTDIELSTGQLAQGSVPVHYEAAAEGALLHLALVELHATSAVKAGENNGATLQHVNVVRDFVTVTVPKGGTGDAALPWPKDLNGSSEAKVIAFLQDPKTGKVLGAADTGLN